MLNVLCTNRTDFFEKARKKETGRNKERREKRKKKTLSSNNGRFELTYNKGWDVDLNYWNKKTP